MSGPRKHLGYLLLVVSLLVPSIGCSRAPAFNVLGSYFPGWIACLFLSVIATAVVRAVLNRLRWEQQVPALPLFYFSIALLIACAIWLIAFE